MRVYARQLFEHLPFLRRYARALTGMTEYGDDLVMRAVEVAIMAPDRFGLSGGSRVPLYALLHLLFDEEGNGEARPAPSPHPIERSLANLPERERRVYLLATLEGLTLAETATVMHVDPTEATARLIRARDAVRGAFTQRVLVVEDNQLLALEIGAVIADMGHVVCGTATTEREALDLVETERPTLALLDVRLADGDSGVEIARRLRQQRSLRTIFVTGFDGDLETLGARHLGPVVSKPFTRDTIASAIARTVFMPAPVALA